MLEDAVPYDERGLIVEEFDGFWTTEDDDDGG